MLMAFLYLGRIKNPEQLKKTCPGEFGKLFGLDRIPETKCLRVKLKAICNQKKSKEWNADLANKWASKEGSEFYYIDGHVQVYSGHNASLGKKHVARQKLCLPGMQEFWVNNKEGLPYFYVTGEVNEKLQEMLLNHIIPKLLTDIQVKYSETELLEDTDLAVFTTVFDREGYSPVLFEKLWNEFRVAVLTYNKNVKDSWEESEFSEYTILSDGKEETMLLAERQIIKNNIKIKEVRKLSEDGHQTSIITTNKKISTEDIATYMFSRWSQENYFKYMRKEYDFDRVLQYSLEAIDGNFIVLNPEYSNLSHYIKKVREKINRRKAVLHDLENKNINESMENTGMQMKRQAKVQEELDYLLKNEEELLIQRKKHPYRIKIKDMPEDIKYNKLNQESKHFQNILKMICYRAEINCANIISEYYKRSEEEKMELVKSIIKSHGDILLDETNESLTISIYSQSNPRMNYALEKLCVVLNEAEHIYPGTNLKLIYKLAK